MIGFASKLKLTKAGNGGEYSLPHLPSVIRAHEKRTTVALTFFKNCTSLTFLFKVKNIIAAHFPKKLFLFHPTRPTSSL